MVVAEWERALQSLRASEILMSESGHEEETVTTSYYAIFHAAKAALFVQDIETSTHSGLRSMFGLHLVQTGDIEPQFATDLTESLDDRVKAEYNVFAHFSGEDARAEHHRARAFLERIRAFLIAQGLTPQELGPTKRAPTTE